MADPLSDWIQLGLDKGYTPEQLTQKLLEKGYSLEHINSAFKVIKNPHDTKTEQPPAVMYEQLKSVSMNHVVVGCLFLSIIGVGLFLFFCFGLALLDVHTHTHTNVEYSKIGTKRRIVFDKYSTYSTFDNLLIYCAYKFLKKNKKLVS